MNRQIKVFEKNGGAPLYRLDYGHSTHNEEPHLHFGKSKAFEKNEKGIGFDPFEETAKLLINPKIPFPGVK